MTREGTTAASDRPPRAIIDLNDILRRVIGERESRRNRADVTFALELQEGLPKVCVDPPEIERVVSLLVLNAEQAVGSSPGRLGQIHVRSLQQGERVQMMVADNGRGIHRQDLACLFGDQSRDVSLTHCAEIVKDHGGELYAWSNYGNGSVFTMELPLPQEFLLESLDRKLCGKRILLIDDEVHVSALMFDVLERQGAEIDMVHSGLQALEQIKSKQYDLMICDQHMPDLTGEGLYRAVGSMNPMLRSRFLFVTGDVLNAELLHFFKETGVHYIQKPFRTVELIAAVKEVINRNPQLDS